MDGFSDVQLCDIHLYEFGEVAGEAVDADFVFNGGEDAVAEFDAGAGFLIEEVQGGAGGDFLVGADGLEVHMEDFAADRVGLGLAEECGDLFAVHFQGDDGGVEGLLLEADGDFACAEGDGACGSVAVDDAGDSPFAAEFADGSASEFGAELGLQNGFHDGDCLGFSVWVKGCRGLCSFHEKGTDRFLIVDAGDGLGQNVGNGQGADFTTFGGGFGKGDGVGEDEFVYFGFLDALGCAAGEDAVGAVRGDAAGAGALEGGGGFAQGVCGVHHVVGDEAVFSGDIADDVHDFGLVCAGSALVQDGEVATDGGGVCAGADDAADIGGDDEGVAVVGGGVHNVADEDGGGVDIVDGDLVEALYLLGVEVHCEEASDAGAGNHVGDDAGGDGDAC